MPAAVRPAATTFCYAKIQRSQRVKAQAQHPSLSVYINWQQPMSTLHHFGFTFEAGQAWQPGSCQSLSATGSATKDEQQLRNALLRVNLHAHRLLCISLQHLLLQQCGPFFSFKNPRPPACTSRTHLHLLHHAFSSSRAENKLSSVPHTLNTLEKRQHVCTVCAVVCVRVSVCGCFVCVVVRLTPPIWTFLPFEGRNIPEHPMRKSSVGRRDRSRRDGVGVQVTRRTC